MKKIIFLFFVLIFSLLGFQEVKAFAPYCVCDYYIEITGTCIVPQKLGYLAVIDDVVECAITSESVLEAKSGNTVCEIQSCEMKICGFTDSLVYKGAAEPVDNPFGPGGISVEWGEEKCVSYSDFEKLDDCEKLVAFSNCDEMASTQTAANISVCAGPCDSSDLCQWNASNKICEAKEVEKIVCANLTKGLKCDQSPEACKNACDKGAPICKFEGGSCVEASSATANTGTAGAVAGTTKSAPVSTAEQTANYEAQYPVPEGYVEAGGVLPPCAFSGTCRNVNDLLQLLINLGSYLFAIIGSFAFAFFIYGGFTIVISFGNAEKVKKGRDIMVAAVVGMVISLSAYMLIDFMLDALDVVEDFRGIK
ncbi:MAG: pilin [Candidatus Magasanikbacteria bacterium]